MASITIRRLADETKQRLRLRAALHGRSMEDEAREIIRATVAEHAGPSRDLAAVVRARFAAFGGVELELPEREAMPEPPDLG
jgi:plasmid stability protein